VRRAELWLSAEDNRLDRFPKLLELRVNALIPSTLNASCCLPMVPSHNWPSKDVVVETQLLGGTHGLGKAPTEKTW